MSREQIRFGVAGTLCLLLTTIIVVVYGTGLDRVPPHLAHDEVVIELNARTVANHGLVGDGNRFPAFFGDSALGMTGGAADDVLDSAIVREPHGAPSFVICER